MDFKLKSAYQPTGDQPGAIEQLVRGLDQGMDTQVLMGVTGSGKTFTMANVIERTQLPTLVITHNKTLAGQLYQEFRDFFPENAVSYFVSYYDYYQPEAYIPQTDTYIEKETDINDEIDKLRLAATTNLLTRKDVIVVASVSCIYNLGSPVEYGKWLLQLVEGMLIDPKDVMHRLNDLQYARADYDFHRGTYRVRGEAMDIFPAYDEVSVRLEFVGNKIGKLSFVDPLTGKTVGKLKVSENTAMGFDDSGRQKSVTIYPAKHYLTDPRDHDEAIKEIKRDMRERVEFLEKAGKMMEAYRLKQKVTYDLEMIQEMGYVNGIENYSRYFDGRAPGDAPYSLIDYFNYDASGAGMDPTLPLPPKREWKGSLLSGEGNGAMSTQARRWLCIIDESHMTIPQIRGMYNGDQARKQNLIDYGFRLPSALDNRPLRFDEFQRRMSQVVCMSATPSEWELSKLKIENEKSKVIGQTPDVSDGIRNWVGRSGLVQQLIRPTGLIDPEVEVRPIDNQVEDLIKEIEIRVRRGERTLVTTLTKRMAEELTEFIQERKINVQYLHSEVETLERMDILERLRLGEYDVVVGINLLREGLDLPEVSLVAILDADKEGFLRSDTSLIQTMGRAARHVNGKVIMYADKVTGSMQRAMDEVNRRRQIQLDYNEKYDLKPVGIVKPVRERMIDKVSDDDGLTYEVRRGKRSKKKYIDDSELTKLLVTDPDELTPEQRKGLVRKLKQYMNKAAKDLNFELAAKLRDKMENIK